MKRTLLVTHLIVIFSFGLVGCQLATAVAQTNNQQSTTIQTIPTVESKNLQPESVNEDTCQQWEQQILATTVRIQMKSSVEFDIDMGREPMSHEAISHATVVHGRYLLTHNHFKISPTYQGNGTSLYATLYKTSGEIIVEAATFKVAFADTETLLLEFADKEGHGLFDSLRIPSAPIFTWESLPLAPGMEVSQINWDGNATQVNCVHIESVVTDEGTPRLELENDIQPGSSGGGVFWEGYHIANNWQRATLYENNSTNILYKFSSAALNSTSLLIAGNVMDETTPIESP